MKNLIENLIEKDPDIKKLFPDDKLIGNKIRISTPTIFPDDGCANSTPCKAMTIDVKVGNFDYERVVLRVDDFNDSAEASLSLLIGALQHLLDRVKSPN